MERAPLLKEDDPGRTKELQDAVASDSSYAAIERSLFRRANGLLRSRKRLPSGGTSLGGARYEGYQASSSSSINSSDSDIAGGTGPSSPRGSAGGNLYTSVDLFGDEQLPEDECAPSKLMCLKVSSVSFVSIAQKITRL
jgi:hypothetical protein